MALDTTSTGDAAADRQACPEDASGLAEGTQIQCQCTYTGFGYFEGKIWGSTVYTADSQICLAAIHAKAVNPAAGGGLVTVKVIAGQSSYASSYSTVVQSAAWGPYGKSFTFPGFSASLGVKPNFGRQEILSHYAVFLPGCETPDRIATWENFAKQGGSVADFVNTLDTVSRTLPLPTCMNVESRVRSYYNIILPGCLNEYRHSVWTNSIKTGQQTEENFVLTLYRVRDNGEAASCLKL